VIEKIIANGIPTTGEKKEVTTLFADLVGFTKLSESAEPTELVRISNGYCECMSRAIGEPSTSQPESRTSPGFTTRTSS
jgi:hypothetical protein